MYYRECDKRTIIRTITYAKRRLRVRNVGWIEDSIVAAILELLRFEYF